jgi:hypothetical protein
LLSVALSRKSKYNAVMFEPPGADCTADAELRPQ